MLQSDARRVPSRTHAKNKHPLVRRRRVLLMEQLESRQLLASDLWLGPSRGIPGDAVSLNSASQAEGEAGDFFISTDKRLTFHSFSSQAGPMQSQLFVADPLQDPRSATALSIAGQEPNWSADGHWLIYSQPNTLDLWITNAFTGQTLPVQQEDGSAVQGMTPVWVGDLNNSISWVGSAVDAETQTTNWDIFYCGITLLADHARLAHIPLNVTAHPGADVNPSWNAEGNLVVFASDRSGRGDIYAVDFYGSWETPPAVNLTADRELQGDFDPALSPDGTQIVFVSSSGNSDLWIMNVDGSGQRPLTSTPYNEQMPAWLPDGQSIVFSSFAPVSDGSPDPEIYSVGIDGSGLRQLTDNLLFDKSPSWRGVPLPPVDLAVSIQQIAMQVEDESFEFLVQISNSGPADANQARLTLDVDRRLLIEQVVAAAATDINLDDHAAELVFPRVAVGATVVARVTARGLHAGNLAVSAEIGTQSEKDTQTSDNRDIGVAAVRPKNDAFSAALTISGASGNFEAANINASSENSIFSAGEPVHAFDNSGTPIAGGRSIWFRWYAPSAGVVEFNTNGSDFDTLLAAYLVVEGPTGKFLSRLASNDDSTGKSSSIQFTASNGGDYYIAVDGYHGSAGAVLLNWSQIAEIIPAPRPQRIQSLSRNSVIQGASSLDLTIQGSGFGPGSIVYLYSPTEDENSRQRISAHYLSTTFRDDSTRLEAHIPARFFAQATVWKVVVVRGNLQSNSYALHVSNQVTLPTGTVLELGKLKITADSITQLAGGAGEGESTEEVYRLQGQRAFNRYLMVDGASVEIRINRAANSLRVLIRQGKVTLTNVPRYGDVELWRGENFEFVLDGEGELTNLLRAVIETPLKERGMDVSITRAKLLLGTQQDTQGRPIYGIEIFGSLKFTQLFGLVNLPVKFDKMILTQNDGLRFASEIGPLNFSINGMLSLKNVYLAFEPGPTPAQDIFRGRARVETPVGINAEGFAEVSGGKLNSLGGELELPSAQGIPIGPIHLVGGGLSVEHLLRPHELKLAVTADATILNSLVAKVLRLDDVTLSYQLPATLGGSATLQILGADVASAYLKLDIPGGKYTFGGGVLIKPDFEVLDVTGELTASVRNNGFAVSGFARGTVSIPRGDSRLHKVLGACGEVPWLGIKMGPCITFPHPLAFAEVRYHDSAFSYSFGLPLLGTLSAKIKRVASDVEATISLFNNVGKFDARFRFGAGGEGENAGQLIGQLTVPENSPRLIVSVRGNQSAPLYNLIMPDGTVVTPQTAQAFGISYFFNEESHDSVFVVENPLAGEWSTEAQPGVTDVISLDAWGVNAAPEMQNLEWTPAEGGFLIDYVANDIDDDAKVSLYYTSSPDRTDGQLIAEDLPEAALSRYVWDISTGQVRSGEYYIYAMVDDGVNAPAVMFHPVPISVQDPLAPERPTLLYATPNAENALRLAWLGSSASDLAGYQIWYAEDQGVGTVLNQRADAGLNTETLLTGLKSNTAYRVAVVAYDRNVEPSRIDPTLQEVVNRFSLPSSMELVTTGAAQPPTPVFAAGGNTKLWSGSKLRLDWDIQNGWDVEWQQLFVSQDGGQTYVLLSELKPDVRQYVWSVYTAATAGTVQFKLVVQDESGNLAETVSQPFKIYQAGRVGFEVGSASFSEASGAVPIVVRRTDGAAGRVSVQFALAAGTAKTSDDYLHQQGVLFFEDGETSQTLFVQLVDDNLVESDEQLAIELFLPAGGASLGAWSTLTLTILNDDVISDSDEDGIDDADEDLAPNGGDGNQDGIPDRLQAHIASLPAKQGFAGLTVAIASGLQLKAVSRVSTAAVGGLPSQVMSTIGIVSFQVDGLTPGAALSYQLRPHSTANDDVYLHFQDRWVWFAWDGNSGGVFNTEGVQVKLQDGARGDTDKLRNGSARVVALLGKSTNPHTHQNPLDPLDVNADGFVSAIDVLQIINDINRNRARPLGNRQWPPATPLSFFDTSGDNFISALDTLRIVNHLNNRSGTGEGEQHETVDPALNQPLSAVPWDGLAPKNTGNHEPDSRTAPETLSAMRADEFFSHYAVQQFWPVPSPAGELPATPPTPWELHRRLRSTSALLEQNDLAVDWDEAGR